MSAGAKLRVFTIRLTKKQVAEIERNLPMRGTIVFSVIAQTRTRRFNTTDLFPRNDIQFAVVDKDAGHALSRVLSKMKDGRRE